MALAKLGDLIKAYVKPTMDGTVILRKKGVIRKSEKVLERNKKFGAAKLATACKGNPWKQFVSCLRVEAARKGLTK